MPGKSRREIFALNVVSAVFNLSEMVRPTMEMTQMGTFIQNAHRHVARSPMAPPMGTYIQFFHNRNF